MSHLDTATQTRQALAQLACFQAFDDMPLEALLSICFVKTAQAGEQLFEQGGYATTFYIILSGQVKIYKLSKEGKEVILHLSEAQDLIAAVPILDGSLHYPACGKCMTDAQLLAFDGAGFLMFLENHPQAALPILKLLVHRTHLYNQLVEDLALRTIEARLARFLLGASEADPHSTAIPMQKKTLAAILGTIPETLSRTFKKLETAGLIRIEGSVIHLTDKPGLYDMANIMEMPAKTPLGGQ